MTKNISDETNWVSIIYMSLAALSLGTVVGWFAHSLMIAIICSLGIHFFEAFLLKVANGMTYSININNKK